MYRTERYHGRTTVAEYFEKYVDIPYFLECCKKCEHYNQLWSCPPYDFSVEGYWKQYQYLDIIGTKIIFDEVTLQETTGQDNVERVMQEVLAVEKEKLAQMLYEFEKSYDGSISLSAGSCSLCKTCSRENGEHCIHPENLRYSIESLGGNVGLTCSKLMGIELLWCEEGKLPAYFTLVSGFLSNEKDEISFDESVK